MRHGHGLRLSAIWTPQAVNDCQCYNSDSSHYSALRACSSLWYKRFKFTTRVVNSVMTEVWDARP